MQLEGYMVRVWWDGVWLVAEPTNKAARFALTGPGGEPRLTVHRDHIASVTHSAATMLTNGRITLETHDGHSFLLHYRRKSRDEFAALVAELQGVARPRVDAAHGVVVPTTPAGPPLRQTDSAWQAPVTTGKEPSAEDVAHRMRLEEPRHPLEEQVEVAGETYYTKGVRRVFRDAGLPITSKGSTLEELVCVLVPEPWNEHDPNAVAVLLGGHKVGHIPAEMARDYAPGLARLAGTGVLATGSARIWAKSDGGMVRARVTLLIPEASAF